MKDRQRAAGGGGAVCVACLSHLPRAFGALSHYDLSIRDKEKLDSG